MKISAWAGHNDPRDVPCRCGAKPGVGCSRLRKLTDDETVYSDGPRFHRSRVDDVVVLDWERSARGALR